MFGDCQWEWFMENPKLVRKKFIAVLKAAICGAAISTAIMGGLDICAHIWAHGHSGEAGPDFFLGIGMIVSIPTILIMEFITGESVIVNPYVVNGLLLALAFGIFGAFRQFLVKGDSEKSESKLPDNETEHH